METATVFEMMGTTGSLIMCASSVPQIWKTYSTKCTDGLSGFYLAILMLGMALIQIYALYVRNIVFIFGNGFSLLLTGILVGLWFRYRDRTIKRIKAARVMANSSPVTGDEAAKARRSIMAILE